MLPKTPTLPVVRVTEPLPLKDSSTHFVLLNREVLERGWLVIVCSRFREVVVLVGCQTICSGKINRRFTCFKAIVPRYGYLDLVIQLLQRLVTHKHSLLICLIRIVTTLSLKGLELLLLDVITVQSSFCIFFQLGNVYRPSWGPSRFCRYYLIRGTLIQWCSKIELFFLRRRMIASQVCIYHMINHNRIQKLCLGLPSISGCNDVALLLIAIQPWFC